MRISTDEQDSSSQRSALIGEGCTLVFEDVASGAVKERPQLKQALSRIGAGDTLIVVRIDRLARSLTHLLSIVEELKRKGAYFRSVLDPIDTSSAQGMLMTQLLGAFAEFERSLIRERTKAGLKAAMARGAMPGNPKMRVRDPIAIAEITRQHKERYLYSLIDGMHLWLPTVERLRPQLPWSIVLRQIRSNNHLARSFSERTLIKACRTLVKAERARPEILERAPRQPMDIRVALLVADRLKSHPQSSLRDVARWLTNDIREPTARGGLTWSAEGVRRVIAIADKLHLLKHCA